MIYLFLIIAILMVYIGYLEWRFSKERDAYTKAILAKNLTDLTSNAIIETKNKEPEHPKEVPVEMSELSDESFFEAIQKQKEKQADQ